MILDERDCRSDILREIAKQMMTAARTAPKAKGNDLLEIKVISGEDISELSKQMMFEAEKTTLSESYRRDANNILKAEQIILIGVKESPMGLNCGYCGFDTCKEKPERVPCTMNSVDVGIALGSACSTAGTMKVDTRVMYSVGKVAMQKGLMDNCKIVYAIPISASSKNPFFDRITNK